MPDFAKKHPLGMKWALPGVMLIILVQVLVLSGVFLKSVWPVWTGREIRLKTRPVDPRSLFRGNYARLAYDISRIPAPDVDALRVPRQNEKIYVRLVKGKDGLCRYRGVSLNRPDSGIFIRGRIQVTHTDSDARYPVRYGIEAYFAPKEKALALERQLREEGVALIAVTGSGSAALIGIGDAAAIGDPGDIDVE